jgi:hypothetical protein
VVRRAVVGGESGEQADLEELEELEPEVLDPVDGIAHGVGPATPVKERS